MIKELDEIIQTLDQTPKNEWAAKYVELKMNFFRRYQNGLIFSTTFGADFFNSVRSHILNDEPLKASGGELGDYDKNFNFWLKSIKI